MYCEKLWTLTQLNTDATEEDWLYVVVIYSCHILVYSVHLSPGQIPAGQVLWSWNWKLSLKSEQKMNEASQSSTLHMSVPTFLVPKVQRATQKHDAVLMKYEPQSRLLSLPPPTVFSETYSSVLFSCNMMLFVTSWLPYCFHNRLLAKSVFMDPVQAFWCVEYHRPYYLFFLWRSGTSFKNACVFLLLDSPELCQGLFIFFNHRHKPWILHSIPWPDLTTSERTFFMVLRLRM